MKHSGLRPTLERKLQEYVVRRVEFEQFKQLNHPYIEAAFKAGMAAGHTDEFYPKERFEKWRKEFAKEEHEKHKRERSTQV